MLPTKEENPNGLHRKYDVRRTDGKPIPEDVEFFVLCLDRGNKDKHHLAACRKAIEAYANEMHRHNPDLANDVLNKWAKPISPNDKAKVFGLYQGCMCMAFGNNLTIYPCNAQDAHDASKAFLKLKHLSAITEEDFQEVNRLTSADLNRNNIPECFLGLPAIDYLRSKGYALSAYGYSVEDLVYFGVFELIES